MKRQFLDLLNGREAKLLAAKHAARWVKLNCNTCVKPIRGKCELLTKMIATSDDKKPDPDLTKRMGGIKNDALPGGYDFFTNKCTELEPF